MNDYEISINMKEVKILIKFPENAMDEIKENLIIPIDDEMIIESRDKPDRGPDNKQRSSPKLHKGLTRYIFEILSMWDKYLSLSDIVTQIKERNTLFENITSSSVAGILTLETNKGTLKRRGKLMKYKYRINTGDK